MDIGNKALAVGAPVPDFEMDTYEPAHGDFGKISLNDLKRAGKWTVLVFYPADFTFVCPTELADLAEKHAALEKLGAAVIGVSTDTKFSHMAWRNSEGLLKNVRYPLAADPTGRVSRLFGVYDEGTGLALRGTFIINPEGKLVSSEINFYNVGRNADELLRRIEANVYLMANPSEACPARWRPGQKTLRPGKELVGNVAAALAD
ncbi:MAG: peroxiredoxin [Verrucomicrobiae bacterium]|nr:peroxiredoxin [Verrucomicrobiae bacterium]